MYTQVYIISQLAVKDLAVLWDATGRSALVSPHTTECKYLQACLSVSKESWESYLIFEQYFYCHSPNRQSTFSQFLWTRFCLIVSGFEKNQSEWSIGGLTGPLMCFHLTELHCQSQSVCKPILSVKNVVLKDENTSFVLFFYSVMEEYMPCPTEWGETIQYILTAPSSTRNGCWLSLMLLGLHTDRLIWRCIIVSWHSNAKVYILKKCQNRQTDRQTYIKYKISVHMSHYVL